MVVLIEYNEEKLYLDMHIDSWNDLSKSTTIPITMYRNNFVMRGCPVYDIDTDTLLNDLNEHGKILSELDFISEVKFHLIKRAKPIQ